MACFSSLPPELNVLVLHEVQDQDRDYLFGPVTLSTAPYLLSTDLLSDVLYQHHRILQMAVSDRSSLGTAKFTSGSSLTGSSSSKDDDDKNEEGEDPQGEDSEEEEEEDTGGEGWSKNNVSQDPYTASWAAKAAQDWGRKSLLALSAVNCKLRQLSLSLIFGVSHARIYS